MLAEPKKLVYKWYALYTRSRAEKRVYRDLVEAGIEAYLPLLKTIRQWSDRKKKVEEPLIRSYVFVKVSEREYYNALNIEGACRYIAFEGKAVPIPDKQIDILKRIIGDNIPFELTQQKFSPGDIIMITAGVLAGIEAEVIDHAGSKKMLVRIGDTGHSMLVNLPTNYLSSKPQTNGSKPPETLSE